MRRGFTLIEILLTAAFLVFTVSAILMLFANCILLNAGNRALTVAMSHAQMVMEEIRDTNFSVIETNITNNYWDWDVSAIEGKGLIALSEEAIDTNKIGAGSDLLNIMVTVSWEGRNQRSKSVSLETLLGEL